MLDQSNRLKQKNEFSEILKRGQRFKIGPLLFVSLSSTRPEPRFGIVVSKKVSNKAVVRNKLRRQLRHLLREAVQNHQIAAPIDVVVLVLYQPSTESFPQLRRAVGEWLSRR